MRSSKVVYDPLHLLLKYYKKQKLCVCMHVRMHVCPKTRTKCGQLLKLDEIHV